MTRLLWIAAGLVAFLLAILAILPNLIPSSVYRNQIETSASEALNRDVTLLGDAKLSVFPSLSVRLGGMQVANPEEFTDEYMIESGALKASVKLLPLLFQRVEIAEITLRDATVRLERLADGRTNWTFGDGSEAPTPETDESEGSESEVNAALGRARLDNASVYLTDHVDNVAYSLTGFTAQARMNAFDRPFSSRGEGSFNDEAFEYDVRVDTLDTLLNGRESDLEVDFSTEYGRIVYEGMLTLADIPGLSGDFLIEVDGAHRFLEPNDPAHAYFQLLGELSFSGTVGGALLAPNFTDIRLSQTSDLLKFEYRGALSFGGAQAIEGALKASSPDLRSVLTLLGIEPAPGETLQTLSLRGNTTGTMRNISLTDTQFELDDLRASGTVGADLSNATPKFVADLAMPRLDLTPFLGASEPAENQEPSLNEDWNDDPLALDALRLINADIDIQADEIVLDQIELDDAKLSADLNDGVLDAAFRNADDRPGFRAFQGDWSGDVRVDAAARTPRMSFKADATGVAAQDLLKALTGYQGVSGIGGLSVDLASTGDSLKALVNDLDGSVETQLADGLVAGLDLAKLVRSADSLQQALRSGSLNLDTVRSAFGDETETDFSSLLGDLTFVDGVATIEMLNLSNSLIDVSGTGQINLGAREIDIRLVPTLLSEGGVQSAVGLDGIPIPLRISGPWTGPSFSPDFSGIESALVAAARDELTNRLADQLGNALGGRRNDGETEAEAGTDADADADAPEEEETSLEQELLNEALGSIFGD